ncbi:T-cell surface glycoprotein CD5 isoform 1-T1 [Morphnus guianensis]
MLEVKWDGRWSRVCRDGVSEPSVDGICQRLGCGPPITKPLQLVFTSRKEPPNTGLLKCTWPAAAPATCHWVPGNCTEYVIVICSEPVKTTPKTSTSPPATTPEPTGPARLRLVDGDFGCSGFVELHRQGLWGAVAESPGIWPELAARICQDLRCGTSIDSRSYAKPERGSHLPVRWEVVESCKNHRLLDCFNRTSARRGEEPAFIICSGKSSPQRGPRSFPGPLACPLPMACSGAAGCFPPCRGVRTPGILLGWMPGCRLAGRLKPWATQQPQSPSAPHTPSTHSCSCSPVCEGKTGNLSGALGSRQRHPQPWASNAAALQVGKPGEREQRRASTVLAPQNPTRACGVWRQSPAPCSSILLRCLPRASPRCEHLPCHEHLPAERLGAGAAARRAKPRGEERACFGSCHLPELKSPPVGFGGLTGCTAAAGRAGFHRCVSRRDSSKLLNAWPRYGSHVSPRSRRHKGKPRCREHPCAKSWSRRKEDRAPAGRRAPRRRP